MIKVLAPLAWLYALLLRLRAWLYRREYLQQQRLPGQVISVGNLEAGGTGKSPLVIAICEELRAQGARPAVLTRGYRSGLLADDAAVLLGSSLVLAPASGTKFQADEALMQSTRLGDVPVIIGRKRFLAARRYLAHYPAPSHWILDDGFQHLGLKRDLDLVLLDAQRPFDNGWSLPAGRLRESRSALKRADAIIFTRAQPSLPDQATCRLLEAWRLPYYRLFFRDSAPRQLTGSPQAAASVQSWTLALGLARPERLIKSASEQGLPIMHRYLVGDHQSFDFKKLGSLLQDSEALLTSEKDYFRAISAFSALQVPVYIMPLELFWDEPGSLSKILQGLKSSS